MISFFGLAYCVCLNGYQGLGLLVLPRLKLLVTGMTRCMRLTEPQLHVFFFLNLRSLNEIQIQEVW